MIHVFFVGDGERDAATVPHLVEGILQVEVNAETRVWRELRGHEPGHNGFARKLLYALRVARDTGVDGVVATVDADKPGGRLRKLKEGRDRDRALRPPVPAALGEAKPHGEAWVLDDSQAVRDALQLPPDAKIPTVRETNTPKGALNALIEQSPRVADKSLDVLRDIARLLQQRRCRHAKDTGFRAFVKEVRAELGPISSVRHI